MNLVPIALLVVSAVLFVSAQTGSPKLKVGIYYETLCPDSARFIRAQLVPLMKAGGEEVLEIQFIPYGKASTIKSGSSYKFTCQHGRAECEGNKMHSCAVKYLSPKETLEFVGCSMSTSYPPGTLSECSREVGVDDGVVRKIKACSESVEGDELLAANGDLTSGLRPRLTFVPTVTYNEVYDYSRMMASQRDFKGIVCEELGNEAPFCNAGKERNHENRGERRVRSFSDFDI